MTTVTYREERRRCGKAACHACRDGPSHGPYWYAYWRDGSGRLRNRYCGKTPPSRVFLHIQNDEAIPVCALRVRLFDGITVERAGVVLTPRDWPRASALKLLVLLLLHPRGKSREEVAEMLWPERDPASSANSLNMAAAALRAVLEPPHLHEPGASAPSVRLPRRQGRLQLHLTNADWVDTQVFAGSPDPSQLTLDRLTNLVALYAGDLVPEFAYEEWTAGPRDALRLQWQALSVHLAGRLIDSGNEAGAAHCLRALLADDPTQEEGARLLMQLMANQGHRDEALRIYRQMHHALDVELGAGPDEHSRSLAESLRHVEPPARTSTLPASAAARSVKQQIDHLACSPLVSRTRREIARLSADRALALMSAGDTEAALGSIETGRLMLSGEESPVELSQLALAEATIHVRRGQPRLARHAAEHAAVSAGLQPGEPGRRADPHIEPHLVQPSAA